MCLCRKESVKGYPGNPNFFCTVIYFCFKRVQVIHNKSLTSNDEYNKRNILCVDVSVRTSCLFCNRFYDVMHEYFLIKTVMLIIENDSFFLSLTLFYSFSFIF